MSAEAVLTPPRAGAPLWRSLLRDRQLSSGLVLLVLIIAGAVLAPLAATVTGHPPNDQFPDQSLDSSGLPIAGGNGFLLGADGSGRDVFVRTLYGARISLVVGIPATTLAMLIGTVVGLLAGYVGGVVDTVLSELTNVALAFPFLITALSVVTLNRGNSGDTRVNPALVVILLITLFSWTYFARIVRTAVVDLRHQPFILAAIGAGAGRSRVLVHEILPNVAPIVIVYWAVQLPVNIVAEASLSYLGVGITAPTASWGSMIANAQASALYQVQPWLIGAPAIALFVTVLAFNLLSTSLRTHLDPTGGRA